MAMTRAQKVAAATAAAVGIAAPAEGLRRVAYYDPVGILTVCYGETKNVVKNKVYTEAECRTMLEKRMLEAVETVEKCVPGLLWNQLAAWSDAVYNMGPTIVCDREKSTAARLLAEGRRDAACAELPKWNKARVAGVLVSLPGLTARREREMVLCLRGFT